MRLHDLMDPKTTRYCFVNISEGYPVTQKPLFPFCPFADQYLLSMSFSNPIIILWENKITDEGNFWQDELASECFLVPARQKSGHLHSEVNRHSNQLPKHLMLDQLSSAMCRHEHFLRNGCEKFAACLAACLEGEAPSYWQKSKDCFYPSIVT